MAIGFSGGGAARRSGSRHALSCVAPRFYPQFLAGPRDLDRLVDAGKSVLGIERHQALMAHADRIIDLGPGAGYDGGRIVFECTPADLVARLRRDHPLVETIERLLRVGTGRWVLSAVGQQRSST